MTHFSSDMETTPNRTWAGAHWDPPQPEPITRRQLATAQTCSGSDQGRLAATRPEGDVRATRTTLPPIRTDAQDSHERTKRGGVLGTCGGGSEFRECRGGDALDEGASTHIKFDQMDYRRTRNGADGKGTCEGIVREAMRRIDRNDANNLLEAVTHMRTEANGGISLADQMFDRIENFQSNRAALQLTRFDQRPAIRFDYDQTPDHTTQVNTMMDRLNERLSRPGDLAIVGLGLHQTGVMSGFQGGHALLVQHNPDNSFTTFDPNNGAFVYPNARDWARAFSGYLDTAFDEAGFDVRPDSIQAFRLRDQRGGPATLVPLPDLVPPEPPLPLFLIAGSDPK
ncbi:hypothetical protein ACFFIG_15575 [Paraburkholderia rhizosphaerae]